MTIRLPQTLRRGLRVSVVRGLDDRNATLDGISSLHSELTIVAVAQCAGARVTVNPLREPQQHRNPTASAPAVFLVQRTRGNLPPLNDIRPAVGDVDLLMAFAAGGNFARLDDGPSMALVEFYGAVAIHDRDETRGVNATVYGHHNYPGIDRWCPWSGTPQIERLPDPQCPAGHHAPLSSRHSYLSTV